MYQVHQLIKRNTKLFFKDKAMFWCSLITPLILLVLYSTFLGKVMKDSFLQNCPSDLDIPTKMINGLVGGQLLASLLAVSCVTVSFCSNILMVQDKITGARKDFLITPVKKSKLAISYYISALISSLIICGVGTIFSFIYLAFVGWYLSFIDCLLIFLDVFLITMFACVLSSIINFFLTSQGQVSAISTIVSSIYGFICGAYMPISTFNIGLQRVLMFLPSTYCTSLLKNHTMRGALEAMQTKGVPVEIIENIKQSVDINISFFDKNVSVISMFLIILGYVILLFGIYILLNKFCKICYKKFKDKKMNKGY